MSTSGSRHSREKYDPQTRRAAVVAGAGFLVATVTFMAGDALIGNAFRVMDAPATGSLVAGVVLQILCGLANVAIGIALFSVLRHYTRPAATGYFVLRAVELVVIVAIGAYVLATRTLLQNYELMIYGFTGSAGLLLTFTLLRTRLAPAWLAWLGVVGYVAIIAAIPVTLLDVATLNSGAGMVLYVPGALFEFVWPVLLIARGFLRTEAPVTATVSKRQFVSAGRRLSV